MKNARLFIGGFFLFMMTNVTSAELTGMQQLMANKQIKALNENNPLMVHKLTADPAVLVYKDTVYIYGTNDSQQAEFSLGKEDNGFGKINTLNVYSSKDLVNWTDCGEIPVAGKNNSKGPAKWATNSWAPAACWKNIDGKDKFFLYFADSGNGIGVLSADSPLGPFTDPLKKPLISRATKNCQKVYWLFDPAVMVDDDGTGYLYFGGGLADDPAHPKSGRCVKLNDDMISIACDPIEIDAPWLFEDSGINKFGDTYYYSYCANWSDRKGATGNDVPPTAVIAYMTSKNPLGPFTYQGWTLRNPGQYFGPWGNNHHWIFTFKGKNYIAFHAQTTEKAIGFEKGGYRSIYICDFVVNPDGSLPIQEATKAGVTPVVNFDPYSTVPAATLVNSKNIAVTSEQNVVAVADGAYILLRGVDLSKEIQKITVNASKVSKDSKVKFFAKNMCAENLIAEIEVKKTGEVTYSVKTGNLPEVADLFIQISNGTQLVNWRFN